MIVLTAKDLTDEDRRLLSGRVAQVIQKGARPHDQIMALVRQVVADVPGGGESPTELACEGREG